jgi:hypothetical protein
MMLLFILGLAILVLLAIVLNDPIDPKEFARFYAPTKTVWGGSVIYAPPLITEPPNHTEAFITDMLPGRRVHNTNGHTITEDVHQISVPMRNVSGYVDPIDPPPLPGIKIRDANGLAIIEGTPQIALPPGIPPVVYGISLK